MDGEQQLLKREPVGAKPPKRLSHVHEAIINWLLCNPDRSLRECSDHFGYSQAWLSTVIHSGLFQSALKARQEGIAIKVAESIPQKMRAVGDMAIEKLGAALAETEDKEFILSATDKILHRLGYAPTSTRNPGGQGAAQGNTQINFQVNLGDLEKARAVMGTSGGAPCVQ